MNAMEAGRILDRLSGHWPAVAANDAAADDWIRVIRSVGDSTATEAAEMLVQGWDKDRAPKIADWQETCRQIVRRESVTEHRALPPPPPAPQDRVAVLIAEARQKLTEGDAKRRSQTHVRAAEPMFDPQMAQNASWKV